MDIEKALVKIMPAAERREDYSKYFFRIPDSVQKKNSVIDEQDLRDSFPGNIPNPLDTLRDVKRDLIPKRKVCITRSDSSFVAVMIRSKESGYVGRIEEHIVYHDAKEDD